MSIVLWSVSVVSGLLGWCVIISASKWLALALAAAGVVGITGLATWIAGGHPWWSR